MGSDTSQVTGAHVAVEGESIPNLDGARLVVTRGPLVGRSISLEPAVVAIGRSPDSTLVVPDVTVSRRHCEIHRDGPLYRLIDLGSSHGTSINGGRVESHVLGHRDRIAIGESELVFLVGSESAGPIDVDLEGTEVTVRNLDRLLVSDAVHVHPERLLRDASVLPLDALVEVGATLQRERQPESIIRGLLDLLLKHIPAERVAVLRVGGEVRAVEMTEVQAIGRGGTGPVRVSATIARKVASDNASLLSNDVSDELLWASSVSVRAAKVTSVMCVPLVLGERAIAVLYLDSSDPAVRFEHAHLQLATAIADLAALPLSLAWSGLRPALASELAVTASSVEEDTAPPLGASVGRAALILRPDYPLHLGNALLLASPLQHLSKDKFSRLVLILDYAASGEPEGASGLLGAVLDRLALFPPDLLGNIALATQVPSVARLATMVASLVRPSKELQDDYLAWFREVLLAAGILTAGATHAVVEPGPPSPESRLTPAGPDATSDLAVTRKLAAQLNQLRPGICPFPVPLLPGFRPFLSLDGRGPMGATAKGAILIADSADAVAKKIRSARTDTQPLFDPTAEVSVEVRNLILLLFSLTGEATSSMLDRFAGKGYSVMKAELTDAANAFLEPIRVRRAALAEDGALRRAIVRDSADLERRGRRLAESLSRSPEALK